MANEKQVRTGEIKSSGNTVSQQTSAQRVPQALPQMEAAVFTPDQLARIQHAILVGTIVGGYLAGGKLIGSNDSKRQVEQAIAFAKEKL